MHLTVLPLLFLLLAAAPLAFSMSTCSVYKNKTDNCAASCGSCFNPGGRGGHTCGRRRVRTIQSEPGQFTKTLILDVDFSGGA